MKQVLGVDVGSVAVSLAVVNEEGRVLFTAYRPHEGAIRTALQSLLEEIDIASVSAVAATLSGPELLRDVPRFDTQVAMIAAVKRFHPDVGSLLFVGGENFGLITFNAAGEYERFRSNSSCAAGTGGFLDQQARRLNLRSAAVLSTVAFCNEGLAPKIATRCAVFAKTDLIHAQQEGYSVGQISDGLCEGLAKNIIDTLGLDRELRQPLVLAGGVALNKAVVRHLSRLLSIEPIVGEHAHLYPAIGAALLLWEEGSLPPIGVVSWNDLFVEERRTRAYAYPPLQLERSPYPDFSSREHRVFEPQRGPAPVECDLYESLAPHEEVYLGIDIGSTSTKAVLTRADGRVIAGFYTYTSGRPLNAVQALFAAIDDLAARQGTSFSFRGVGTTGSGRKFIGRIIAADLVVDEITAHARAAYELNPAVDTIIEIGGQDAKFTTMKEGMVTLSVMNTVCAAGTGSFVEEQAKRLGVPLSAYADRALEKPAPAANDRCTVFMERDITTYLMEGYTTDEVLAAVLHAVRENYLSKVAVEAHIGENICFQGATARNKALVAAFEQRLKKPIFVSKFCHLTGALGCALILAENRANGSSFRGTGMWREEIPLEHEVCELCHNHCKITKITVQGETVAFGFLCGRDYDTRRYVGPDRAAYDLIRERRAVFQIPAFSPRREASLKVGIPNALYLAEEMPFWRFFFGALGIETVTSENFVEAVAEGKRLSRAEFCAPMQAFFGHVAHLADKCDLIFLPSSFEAREKDREVRRFYCYYTQYAAALVLGALEEPIRRRVISPVVDHQSFQAKIDLFRALKPHLNRNYWEIYNAYESARSFFEERKGRLRNIYERETMPRKGKNDIAVVLLGRPYTVLQPAMNKGVPDIFSRLGISVFSQDMLPYRKEEIAEIDPLLKRLHWNYAAKILKAALFAAHTPGLYPVYVTSFKCAPDSFALEYFRRIMEHYGKPYLVLEVDEHDSNVGYETRIEAAVRAFRNHAVRGTSAPHKREPLPVVPTIATKLPQRKTLLFPCIDPFVSKLYEAIFIKEGVDARLVPLTDRTIKRGIRKHTGQCLPVTIIAQSYADYIEDQGLDPAMTAVWMFESYIPCNIPMYPHLIKSLLETYDGGMEKVEVYLGELTMNDLSVPASVDTYFANLFGGMLRKAGCRIRPYEKQKGETDRVLADALNLLYNTFIGGAEKEDAVARIVARLKAIGTDETRRRPQVAIFGDMYARDNDVFNQHLIRCIEEYGGEAVTTPFTELIRLALPSYIKRWFAGGHYGDILFAKTVMTLVGQLEKSYYRLFSELFDEPLALPDIDHDAVLREFFLTPHHAGESLDNLVKIAALVKHYPDLALFVQVNPAFCCAGLVTEAMVPHIEQFAGIPVVTLNYDGTSKNINEKIRPYIRYPRRRG